MDFFKNATLVIRWRKGTDEKALAPLLSSLAFFPGENRVSIYLEKETRLLDNHNLTVLLNQETLALLTDRFGVDNVSLF